MPQGRLRLVVGLGNPGEAYSKTRHNAGFMVVDKVSD
ncbi:MAG: aminoacyl-tRNA hydrolase, partial [Desulfobacterales bacterium]